MCGIAGLFDTHTRPTEAELRAMNDCLDHRGPDADGIHLDGPVGLAHQRLSIIDLKTGEQPIFNETDDVAVVFNGEIYNYRTLRDELQSKGHRFRTDTDTEVLVHAYEEYGPKFVSRLDGMFAFAIWDAEREKVVLARDPLGVKPLLVACDGDRVGFASELPALLESRLNHGTLDERAIASYFALGYVQAPRTVFRNVRKVRPGQRLVVDADGITRTCFYEPSIRPHAPGVVDAAHELRSMVGDAVEKRLMSDVPLGAFLSGGIDSSVVVATMAERSDDPVRTFTVGFDERRFDESGAARRVADYHDTDHTEYTVSPDTVRELVPELISQLGEPFADPSLVPTYVVARETSQDVTVALSGDGADELFAGYGKYRGEYLSGYYRAVPATVRRRLVEPVVERLPASRNSALGELARKAQKFTAGGEPAPALRHFGWVTIADGDATRAVRTTPAPITAGEDAIEEAHRTIEPILPPSRLDSLTRMQAADIRGSLPDQLLTKVDLASMYNSLEVRVPFLDTSVVEYATSLPTSYKMTATTRKRVLKKAFDDLLPDAILKRDKQGFDMPIGAWFKGPLAGDFRQAVTELETEVVDIAAVMDVYESHCRGRRDHSRFLWAVYVFALWYRRMERQGYL